MANTFRDGTVNIAAIDTPGVAVDIIAPTPFITAAPSRVVASVGAASWSTPNTLIVASGPADGYAKLGRPKIRYGDLGTALAVGLSQGNQAYYNFVRVTDGTDVAANVALPNNLGRFTARSSGTLGNSIGIQFLPSAAIGAFGAVVQFPGVLAEKFDSIFTGLASVATAPGTGYTSVPSAMVTAPQKALSGVQATVQPTLTNLTQAVAAGGAGYVAGDKITLPNGLVLTVATVTGGAVATVTVSTPASLTAGAVPTNPVAQTATTGSGTGATFTLTWGLGVPTFSSGAGYSVATGSALTITLVGGGATTPGSYTPTMTFGAALATAINLGTQQRGRSGYVVFTPSTGTGLPTLNTPYQLAGGTDGDVGVTSTIQMGQDGAGGSRTGAYVLRGTNMSLFTLMDCNDPTVVPAMTALAISETAVFDFSTAQGDTIAGAVATRASYGFDDVDLHMVAGDYATFNDGMNGSRLVYPSAFAVALAGNLSPQYSFINKKLTGVLATQGSSTGLPISNADNSAAQEGGIDIIGRTASLGVPYFSFVTGRSTSSNSAARGLEYSLLTNWIARSLAGPATASIVGLLQSINRPDDPTRAKAKGVLDGFGGILTNPAYGDGQYGIIEQWASKCDQDNNPRSSVAQGFLIAYVAALYLNTVRVFLIQFNGGGNVQIQQQTSTATTAAAAIAALGTA